MYKTFPMVGECCIGCGYREPRIIDVIIDTYSHIIRLHFPSGQGSLLILLQMSGSPHGACKH